MMYIDHLQLKSLPSEKGTPWVITFRGGNTLCPWRSGGGIWYFGYVRCLALGDVEMGIWSACVWIGICGYVAATTEEASQTQAPAPEDPLRGRYASLPANIMCNRGRGQINRST